MFVKPCFNCPHRKGCERKAEKLAAVRGLGLTSIAFKCDKRLSELQPGQRIEFTMMDGERGSALEPWSTYTFQAIVMRPYKHRILVWLVGCDHEDEEPDPHPQQYEYLLASGKNPIAVSPDRVRPVNGRVPVCPDCGQPEGTKPEPRKDGSVAFACFTCHPELMENYMVHDGPL